MTTSSMTRSVFSLDTASHNVRLLTGSMLDGRMNGNRDNAAVVTTETTLTLVAMNVGQRQRMGGLARPGRAADDVDGSCRHARPACRAAASAEMQISPA